MALIDDPDARTPTAASGNDYPLAKITHFAWVINDVKKVDAFTLGLASNLFRGSTTTSASIVSIAASPAPMKCGWAGTGPATNRLNGCSRLPGRMFMWNTARITAKDFTTWGLTSPTWTTLSSR